MNFFIENLRETLEAINGLDEGEISVKRIKQERKIKPSDRSMTSFTSRALRFLVKLKILSLVKWMV